MAVSGLLVVIGVMALACVLAWFQMPVYAEKRRRRDLEEFKGPNSRDMVESLLRSSSINLLEEATGLPEFQKKLIELQLEKVPTLPSRRLELTYVLRYPAYWFSLSPFRLRLGLGKEEVIRDLLGVPESGTAEEKGPLVFEAFEEEPWLTAEVIAPSDAAKVPEALRKQTKRVAPQGATLFEFLVTPAAAEDLTLGVRITYRIPVPRESRSKTITKEVTVPPPSAEKAPGETIKEEYSLKWELVDLEVTTIWIKVQVRTLFGLSMGTTNLIKAAISPVAAAVVLLLVLRQDPGADRTYFILTAIVGILGAKVPQSLVDFFKTKKNEA